jgi:hypothetical protein
MLAADILSYCYEHRESAQKHDSYRYATSRLTLTAEYLYCEQTHRDPVLSCTYMNLTWPMPHVNRVFDDFIWCLAGLPYPTVVSIMGPAVSPEMTGKHSK